MKKTILILIVISLGILISGCVQQPIIDKEFCNLDEECIPASCCHSTLCVNSKFAPNCENVACTEIYMSGAAYELEDCICTDNKCVNKNLEELPSDAESACVNTGGTWEYSDCNGHCIPETKEDRLKWLEEGHACTAVCVEGYKCSCPDGFYWASKEEGCLRIALGPMNDPEYNCETVGGNWTNSTCECPQGYSWDSNEEKCLEQ